MTSSPRKLLADISTDERGSIAILFGLMFMILIMFCGMAIDYARVQQMQTRVIAAADAAALAAGRALLDGRLTDTEVQSMAVQLFEQNIPADSKLGKVKTIDVNVNRLTGSVTVDINAEVPMTVMRVAGFEKIGFPVKSSTLFDQKDIELGMALDITGSMAGSKIADLKLAAKDLIDILLPDSGTENKIRIGLAPYAQSVNAGSYAKGVTGGTSNSCVHERSGTDAFSDALPTTGKWLGWSKSLTCPSAKVEPMTDNKGILKSRVDGYTANGGTAGHLGAAWAWYLVSPEWASIWPSASRPVAYNDGKTNKAIILMTDGEFNTSYVSANGDLPRQALEVCRTMKTKGVLIYAVAFQSPGSAEALLKSCATSPDHFFNAKDGNELRSSFQQIATSLNNLRLTQ